MLDRFAISPDCSSKTRNKLGLAKHNINEEPILGYPRIDCHVKK